MSGYYKKSQDASSLLNAKKLAEALRITIDDLV